MERKQLTRTYTGKEILCKYCKTKRFQTTGNKEKYGVIAIHKKGCKSMKNLRYIK